MKDSKQVIEGSQILSQKMTTTCEFPQFIKPVSPFFVITLENQIDD